MLTLVSDEGSEGHFFGANAGLVERVIRPALVGEDPFDRERIWTKLKESKRINRDLLDRHIGTADLALCGTWRATISASRSTSSWADSGTKCPPTRARCAATRSRAD